MCFRLTMRPRWICKVILSKKNLYLCVCLWYISLTFSRKLPSSLFQKQLLMWSHLCITHEFHITGHVPCALSLIMRQISWGGCELIMDLNAWCWNILKSCAGKCKETESKCLLFNIFFMIRSRVHLKFYILCASLSRQSLQISVNKTYVLFSAVYLK